MDDSIKKYLYDVLECIDFIEETTSDLAGFKEYQSNRLLKPAIERKIEVIGEAINKAHKLYPDLELTNMRKIISMRNRIIHAYDAVDDVLIWEVVKKHLPILKNEVEALIND